MFNLSGLIRGVTLPWWTFIILALFWVLSGGLIGCQQPNMEPMERSFNTLVTDVVKPAMDKMALDLTERAAQISGSAQGINPGYKASGHVYWVGAGLAWEFTLETQGIAGQLMASTTLGPRTTSQPAQP